MQELKRSYNHLDTVAAMKLYQEGKTDRQIEGILGNSRKTIAKWRSVNKLPSHGKPRGNPNHAVVDYQRLAQLVREGKTTTEIMGIMGVCKSTVNKWKRENGCALPKGKRSKSQSKGGRPHKPKSTLQLPAAVCRTRSGRPLYMTNNEIRLNFRDAANKQDMLTALSELNLCPVSEMADHLETLGFDMAEYRKGSGRRLIDDIWAKELYDAGATDNEIAEVFGVKAASIAAWRWRNQLPALTDRRKGGGYANQNSG